MLHRSAIALLLSAALSNAEFLTPNRGDDLAVNEAFAIQWETDGLVEPLSINLVPSGPGDFVVAQQVGVDIANSGELEFIPDASIANFDAFQFVLSDAQGNSLNSEPFSINGLTEDPVLATVSVESVQTVVATQDGAAVTQLETSVEEAVASIPADPIRVAVSGAKTVNQVLTAAPFLSSQSSSVSSQSESDGASDSQSADDVSASNIDVSGGVAQEGPLEFDTSPSGNAEALALNGDIIAAGAALPKALSPGDPGFVDIGDRNLGVAAQPAAAVDVAAQPPAAVDVAAATVNVAETAIDSALQFTPIAAPAATVAAPNTLVGAAPAATAATIGVGEVAQDSALSFAPVASVASVAPAASVATAANVAVGGFTPINAPASAAASANAIGGISNSTGTGAGFNAANLNGGVGNNGALTVEPISSGIPLNTNVVGPSLGVPTGGPLVPDVTAPGAPLDPNSPVQTGVPLGGGVGLNGTNPIAPGTPLDPNNPNGGNLPGGIVGTGTNVAPPLNTNLLGGNGPTLSTGPLVGTTLSTGVLGGSTGLTAPSGTNSLSPQNSADAVEVNAADKLTRHNAVLGGIVALAAAMIL